MIEWVVTVEGEHLQIGADGVLSAEADSIEEVDPAQVKECLRWFGRAETTPEPTVSSFWLKHVVQHGVGVAVSNGAVIIAAHRMGFPIGREPGETSANVTIGVARHCIDEFDCGCGYP